MKKYFLSIFILLAIQLGAFSQNFNRLTQIVDAPQITNGQVAYFVMITQLILRLSKI